VADGGANSVTVIDTATNTVKTTFRVGTIPVDVSITPDGVSAYVANAGAKSVSVIDTTTNTVVATVRVEFIPVHVSISPDGAHAYDQCGFELRFSHRPHHQHGGSHGAGWSSPGQMQRSFSSLNPARRPGGTAPQRHTFDRSGIETKETAGVAHISDLVALREALGLISRPR
jgi:YVTN family beta-propeller protein